MQSISLNAGKAISNPVPSKLPLSIVAQKKVVAVVKAPVVAKVVSLPTAPQFPLCDDVHSSRDHSPLSDGKSSRESSIARCRHEDSSRVECSTLNACVKDPLVTLVSKERMLQMRRDASQRQLETLQTLIECEGTRLAEMNRNAASTVKEWGLIARRCHKGTFIGTDVVASLEQLERGMRGDGGNALHCDGDDQPVASASTMMRLACAEYLTRYPRQLLTAKECEEVDIFVQRFHQLSEQAGVLDTLLLHEGESLAAVERELASLRSGPREHPSGKGESPHRRFICSDGANQLVEPREPVVVTAPSPPAAVAVDATTQHGSSPIRIRSIWARYLPNYVPGDEFQQNIDDMECCRLIDKLLDEVKTLRTALTLSDDSTQQQKLREHNLVEELEMVNTENRNLEESLEVSNRRCQEYETLLAEALSREQQLSRSVLSGMEQAIHDEEQFARTALKSAEETHFVRIETLQLQAFLVYAAHQRQAIEELLEEERVSSEANRDAAEHLLRERDELDSAAEVLREEVASMGADRALLRAKVEMYQDTIRSEGEKFRKCLEIKDAEIQQFKEKALELEVQLDIFKSSRVSKEASARAVEGQSYWDLNTTVKMQAMKTLQSARVAQRSDSRAGVPPSPTPQSLTTRSVS